MKRGFGSYKQEERKELGRKTKENVKLHEGDVQYLAQDMMED